MAEFTPIVIRKPPRELPPPFVCAICERTITEDPWSRVDQNKPPICCLCDLHWGSRSKPPGLSRGDFQVVSHLVAIVSALEWEVRNGRRYRH